MDYYFKEENGYLKLFNENEMLFSLEGKSQSNNTFTYFLTDREDFKNVENILEISPFNFPKNLRVLFYDFPHDIDGNLFLTANDKVINIQLQIEHDIDSWRNPFTIQELNEQLNFALSKYNYSVDDEEFFTIDLKTQIDKSERCYLLSEIIKNHAQMIERIVNEEKIKLTKQNIDNLLVKIFDFPDEYKVVCSQYLVWFGEFLKNVGIEADVSTEQNKGKTILTIAPEKNSGLLQKIEQLFYQYLQLPYVELLPPENAFNPQERYAYQTAVMQVQHLQTQIQMKDAAIANFQAANSSLVSQLETVKKQLLVNSLKDEKKYEFFDGLITIPAKHSIGKNISFDLSKILESIKKNKKEN